MKKSVWVLTQQTHCENEHPANRTIVAEIIFDDSNEDGQKISLMVN